MRRTYASAAAICAALLPAGARAQGVIELAEIVVYGGLTPVLTTEYGRAYAVLTAEEIEQKQIVHLADALRALPGVSVNQAGSYGNLTQIRIRGAEGNHTLVLIDGVEVSAPENGEYDFAGLLAADIARVEVLRGPQSSLYGSNAIGGVISITTKGAEEAGFSAEAGAEAGSDGSFGGDFALRGGDGRAAWSFSAADRRTGGFDASNDPGGDKDGDRNLTLNFKGSYALTDTVTLGATLRRTDRTGDYDNFNFGAATHEDLVTDAALQHQREELFGSVFLKAQSFGGRMESELRFGFTNQDDTNTDAGLRTTDTTGTRRSLHLQTTVALDAGTLAEADHTLTGRLEWERETFKANDPALVYDPSQLIKQSRELKAAVMEYRGHFGEALDAQLGLRFDDNDRFADATTWSLGLSYALPNGTTRLHASAGTGVQNPTLYDQFGFIPGTFVGNPALEPEKSRGWDVGVTQELMGGRGSFDVTYFEDRLTNEITTVYDPVTFEATPANQAGASRRKGVEVSADFALTDSLRLGLGYTYLDARDPDGTREVRRPMHELGLDLGYSLPNGRTQVSVGVQHVAGLVDYDFTAPSYGMAKIPLQDYTLVNLSVSHALTDKVELTGRVENLFDARYQEVDGYATQGLTAYIGLRTRW
jgi:vitamin B12 transporter